ncbi:DUF1194 domain-containing protein [Enterovirga sp.]|jgi:hypothetical protein|uniref:DUF1194 domain-containing protein n=1 Tax=Enterovirga sp. TaxID=2026350 RepID=UPI002614DA1E|nr:DUF1194 domain-containing protein [Enterovirga sp.]MDB5592373.1 hypothetical protein [Enterovirga sp.]
MLRRATLGLLATWLCLAGLPARAGGPEVDLALVLAVDVSWSMDPEEQDLQKQGFIEAFRSPEVHEAIRRGLLGRVAVTYFEWASASHQDLVLPWTVISGPEDALAVAERLSRRPAGRAYYTSISGAIAFGQDLLARSGLEATRQVIDISGDGPNNDGPAVTAARDAAVAAGVVVNGLPIMLKQAVSPWDIAHLDRYYRACVIGGAGAFLVPVRERAHFAGAIRTKLVREIAALPGEARIRPAQAEPAADCLIGEALRRQRRWN